MDFFLLLYSLLPLLVVFLRLSDGSTGRVTVYMCYM